jgi:folate-binding protein YgfZ
MKYVRLERYECVRVIGPDARKFLQGQVTCNMERVQESVSLAGALCNLKGRVVADFRAIAVADGIVLQTQPSMAGCIADVLKKYAVFSKVEITVGGFDSSALGCMGEDTPQQLSQQLGWQEARTGNVFTSQDFIIVSLDASSQRVEIYPLTAKASDTIKSLENSAEQCSIDLWQRAEIEAGVFHVSAELSEEFTPQLLNYDISGIVDFKKGCYTGQEIVARMFYRSTPKKRLTLLSSAQPIAADANIEYTENNATFITPVLAFCNAKTQDQQNSVLLAIVGIHAAESSTPPKLTNNEQTSLLFLTMPYTQIKE